MRRLALTLLVLLALASAPIEADDGCSGGGNYTAITYDSEKITVSSTSIGFTVSKIAPSGSAAATRAFCSNETDSIRFLTTGVDPAAATGVLVAAGSYFEVCQEDIRRFRAIRVTADATINCLYQRPSVQ